jgi:GTP cyclohydrolase I
MIDEVVDYRYELLRAGFASVVEAIDPDWSEHPHLKDTPSRVARMFTELLNGTEFEFTTFDNKDVDQMVLVRDIYFYSLCAHHMLPFHGHAHVAYIPGERLVGLSKFARVVDHFSRGLNIQEELTADIKNFLVEELKPKGVGVILEAEHLCMSMRGIERPGHLTTTSAMQGVFLDPSKGARQEFLELIGRRHA